METSLRRPPIPMRRIWLDATQEDDSGTMASISQVPPVPVPVLPPQPSPALSAPESRRRSAVSANSGRTRKRNDKSPEIISNLIDSLSHISVPDHDHDRPVQRISGAQSTPATPLLRPKRSFGGASVNGGSYSSDYNAYRQALSEGLVGPDDAAEPPVIRTSKRPSGQSEWTAPKKQYQHGLGSYLRSGYARSASSLASFGRDDDARSIGGVSIETAARRRSMASASRESLESRRSNKKGHKGFFSSSKDAESPGETVLVGTGISDQLYSPGQNPASPKRKHPFQQPIQEEPSPPLTSTVPRQQILSKKEGKKPMVFDNFDSSSPANGPIVPSRRSSLRHQESPNTKENKPNSRQPSAAHSNQGETLKEEEETQSKAITDPLDGDDTEVTKRIKELRARKEQRDREARQSPTPEFENSTSSSAIPGLNLKPVGSLVRDLSPSSQNETRSTVKPLRAARPGAIHVPPPGPLTETPKSTQNGASQHLASPQRPTTPLTPTLLPINYSYVVNTLNQDTSPNKVPSTNDESVREASTKDSIPTTTQQRRKSIAIGGRSAVSRTTVSKSLYIETVNGNSDSRYSSPEPASGSTSPTDRQSTDTFSTQGGTKSRRSSSLRSKRRRWSHPDLPSGIERKSSMRGSDSLAVRPPERPEKIVEERPTSADSVEQDVKSFIHGPRLSQKIRHPASGRTIAFSEVGDPKGHAVFCCVGMGLTRYVTAFYDELAMTLRLRLITPDRPGVGESQSDPNGTPLSWPDDVLAICQALYISKFSILAHSAGAIYALATALRMPQHIRGRVHLLAPWIPPSQMAPIGITKQDPPPGAQLPKSQRFLRVLPAPFLKVANTGFLSAASASLSPNGTNSPRREKKRKSLLSKDSKDSRDTSRSGSRTESPAPGTNGYNSRNPPESHVRRESIMLMDQQTIPDGSAIAIAKSSRNLRNEYGHQRQRSIEEDIERRELYDSRLTLAIWDLATTNANPAVDLLICLERHQPIGFMYKDITRAVVIHHGSKDTRVPIENVRWLGRAMRRCEVRVLEGEGHGLMASATVMGGVLEEVGREWRDWEEAVKRGGESNAVSNGASRRESQKSGRRDGA